MTETIREISDRSIWNPPCPVCKLRMCRVTMRVHGAYSADGFFDCGTCGKKRGTWKQTDRYTLVDDIDELPGQME